VENEDRETNVPAPQDTMPDTAEVEGYPATVDVENLDESNVVVDDNEVDVVGDHNAKARAAARARARAKARPLDRRQRRAEVVEVTDVENLDANAFTEEETAKPDFKTDPEVPE